VPEEILQTTFYLANALIDKRTSQHMLAAQQGTWAREASGGSVQASEIRLLPDGRLVAILGLLHSPPSFSQDCLLPEAMGGRNLILGIIIGDVNAGLNICNPVHMVILNTSSVGKFFNETDMGPIFNFTKFQDGGKHSTYTVRSWRHI